MTDQRDRVITDPGIGPVDHDNCSTLRSIAAAEEVEPDGASLYYEPKPLISSSDHKTLEVATVRLAEDIDPRRVPTELSLSRSPPPPPQYDSAWPQGEVILTRSERPSPPRNRWRVPLLMLTVLGVLLGLVLARGAVRDGRARAEQSRAAGQVPAAGFRPAAATRLAASARIAAPASSALSAAAAKAAPVVNVGPIASGASVPPSSAMPSQVAAARPAVFLPPPSSPSAGVPSVAAPATAGLPRASVPSTGVPSASVPSASAPSAAVLRVEPSARSASASHPSSGKPNLQSSGSEVLPAPSAATAKRAIY